MPGPPVLNGPFIMPMVNGYVPRKLQPWCYLIIAFLFQLSGTLYSGNLSHFMGHTCLMREDALMIILCGVVGVNMPFPFLFRLKFRFTNRTLLLTAALVVGCCNLLALITESLPLLCVISYVAGFFKLCGTFECMTNIQLWMTPKRDFTIFFPLLYSIVLGSMAISPFASTWLTYIFQDWRTMNYVMAGMMFAVALFVFTCTHHFRFMKPLPFVSLDWLGCLLWSALLIEIIFLFNYGEYYNWWQGRIFRQVAWLTLPTLYFTIQRMRHIRHPYISPDAWKYRGLFPMLGVFAVVEWMGSTTKVLQVTFTGGILHFGSLATSRLYILEWMGYIIGCLSVLVWVKVLRLKYTRMLSVGFAALLIYQVMLYFMVSPGVDLASLYVPTFFHAAGIAIFFTALTIYLEDLMPFEHFFMGLTMIGMVRTGVMETVCSGVYSYMLRHHIVVNLSRGIPYEPMQAIMVSVKQLYGATCIMGSIILLFFLLWNIQPVRSTLKKMPTWNFVGRMMKKQRTKSSHSLL